MRFSQPSQVLVPPAPIEKFLHPMPRQTSILELMPDEETERFVIYGVDRDLDAYRGEQHARYTAVLTPGSVNP
jgi:hypothetical protein